MTDHDALLRAVCENPDDDTPRLVYADWLEENGPPQRAAFIRTDIAADRLDPFDPVRLRWELVEKPRLVGQPWLVGSLPELPPGGVWPPTGFRRGFPRTAAVSDVEHLAEFAAGAFARAPITYLFLAWRHTARLELLTDIPWPARLSGLGVLSPTWGRPVVRRLAESRLAGGLRELGLTMSGLKADGVRELIGSPLFARLTALSLVGARNAPSWREPLIESPHIGHLRKLDLTRTVVTSALPRLLVAPVVRGLEELSLRGMHLRFAGAQAVAAADVPGLVSLDLGETVPGEEGLNALAASSVIRRLRKLDLSRNAINRERCVRLAEAGAFAGLRVLRLTGNPVGNDGTVALVNSPHSANLRVLDLDHCQVGDEGVEAILASPLADRLVWLNLLGSPASAEAKELAKARLGDRVRV